VNPAILLFALLPVVSTILGGFAAYRLRHRIHPIMAIAAGALVATALVNLLPEAVELTDGSDGPIGPGMVAVLGYLLFTAVESLVHRETYEHRHPPLEPHEQPHEHPAAAIPSSAVGVLGPIGLIVHSFMDGLAIGLGFEASPELGVLVGVAVLAHDFADGINIATLALAGGASTRYAAAVVAMDAIAAPAGVLAAALLTPDPSILGWLLALFAGVFIAIGAGHLLPEAQHRRAGHTSSLVVLAAVGAVIIMLVRLVIS
jgi:ZIP family zinc transporter